MIKALRIKVALESDCGNGEAVPKFPAEQKMGKALPIHLTPVKLARVCWKEPN